MSRRYTAMAAVIAIWGLVACDSNIVDSLLADDGIGSPDASVDALVDADVEVRIDADSDATVGPDDGGDPDGPPPPLDAALGDGPVVSDATPDAVVDAMGDGPPPDAIPDMTQPDAMPDVAPPDPDAAPDSGTVCLDDAQCEGICDDGLCAPCAGGDECPGGRCEAGACLDCRDGADCGGAICEGGVCRPCIDRAECGGGQACIGGVCGACVGTPDCAGDVCVDGACQRCDPADHDGCGPEALCCDTGQGVECTPTDPVTGCGACGEPCDADASDACVGRICRCGGDDACGDPQPYCAGEPAAAICVACRDDADCEPGFVCLGAGGCAPETVIDVLRADAELEAMLEFITIAGLEADLSGRVAVTLFAATNAGFDGLSGGCINAIVVGGPTFVRHHTLRSREVLTADLLVETADALPEGVPLLMESNDEAVVARRADGQIILDGLPLLRSLDAGNGVVHVLGERVLLTEPYAGGCEPAR